MLSLCPQCFHMTALCRVHENNRGRYQLPNKFQNVANSFPAGPHQTKFAGAANRENFVVPIKYHRNFENRISTATKTSFGLEALVQRHGRGSEVLPGQPGCTAETTEEAACVLRKRRGGNDSKLRDALNRND